MNRFAQSLCLWLLLASSAFAQNALEMRYIPGEDVCVQLSNGSTYDMTVGGTARDRVLAAATLSGASLPAGWYTAEAFASTAANYSAADATEVSVWYWQAFYWDGSAVVVDQPLTSTLASHIAAIWSKLPFDDRRMAGAGLQVTDLDDVEAGAGGDGETPLLYLGEPDFVWELPKRSTRRLYAENPLRIAPGESMRAGFRLQGSRVLPAGSVPSNPQEPTGLTGQLTAELAGISERYITLVVTAGDDATPGDEQWVEVEVSNSSGGGPFKLTAPVIVTAAQPTED